MDVRGPGGRCPSLTGVQPGSGGVGRRAWSGGAGSPTDAAIDEALDPQWSRLGLLIMAIKLLVLVY